MSTFPWVRAELLCWRLDERRHGATWDSGKGSEIGGGRWNPKGFATVYTSLDPATAVLEVAVHKGFDALDVVPHVMACMEVVDPSLVHVVTANEVPNPSWLRSGTPSHGQQQFGLELLQRHAFVAIPSAVLPLSWNLFFSPTVAAGGYTLKEQTVRAG